MGVVSGCAVDPEYFRLFDGLVAMPGVAKGNRRRAGVIKLRGWNGSKVGTAEVRVGEGDQESRAAQHEWVEEPGAGRINGTL
eukprot:1885418-Pleurochrysis_carterae.AAC.2